MKLLEKYSKFIVAAILVIMFIVSLGVSLGDAAIMDEVAHIPAGYTYLKYHDFRLNPEHPPLIKDLSGIPLQFLNLTFPVNEEFWTTDANGQWNAGWRFIYPSPISQEQNSPDEKDKLISKIENWCGVYFPNNNTEQILFWSRLPIILISLLLGWFIYFWAKELFGIKAGLLALTLYAFDPNILGHNHYVTTDLGIAAFLFFAFYFFVKYLKTPNYKTIILAGIFLGLAQLAKFSAVLLFPVFGLILLLYAIFRKEKINFSFLGSSKIKKLRLRKIYLYFSSFVLVAIICFLVIWVVYAINIYKMPAGKIHQLIDTQLYGGLQQSIAPHLHQMADNPVLRPYSQYFTGLLMVIGRVSGGNTTYFFGEVTNQSFTSYFPLVFLIKEPIPSLVLILSAMAIGFWLFLKNNARRFPKLVFANLKKYLNRNIAEFSMLLFITVYLYTSITGNLNIGLRHLFPILPFVYILVSKEIVVFGGKLKKNYKKVFSGIISILIIWLIAETAFAYPYYLAYFNELVGGSKNGYKYVTDSNVDWGQELKRLARWVEENNIDKIRVDYFGGGDVKHYLGDKAIIWHADRGQENGWYAVSATFLQNSLYYKINFGEPDYGWLRAREPYASIGHSIMIYKIEDIK